MINLTEKYQSQKVDGVNLNYVFLKKEVPNYNVLVLRGGTRSGKSYAAVEYLVEQLNIPDCGGVTASRSNQHTLKATVRADFENIMGRKEVNPTHASFGFPLNYLIQGNRLDFLPEYGLSVSRNKFLYIAQPQEYLDLEQLDHIIDNHEKVILDISRGSGTSEQALMEMIKDRWEYAMIETSFRDNPFITQKQRDEIEWMISNDPEIAKQFVL